MKTGNNNDIDYLSSIMIEEGYSFWRVLLMARAMRKNGCKKTADYMRKVSKAMELRKSNEQKSQ